MLKKLIKKIFHKIYLIGYFEDLNNINLKRNNFLDSRCQIHKTAWIAGEASIINESRPKDKLKIGANSRIMGQLFVFDVDGEITIGDDCFVGKDTRIWSSKNITIGNRVLIAHNVNIHDNISHPLNAQERYNENYNFVKNGLHSEANIKAMPIIIEDDVWIGFNTMILRGVTIGRGAIIGAGSVVTKNVEPFTVNVGSPLRCLQKLDPIEVKVNK